MWSAGVVMAIMLNDCSHPYIEKGESERLIKEKIINNQLNFDKIKGSAKALDLLKRLLNPNPQERMKAAEALGHPWFPGRKSSTFEVRSKIETRSLISTLTNLGQSSSQVSHLPSEPLLVRTKKTIAACFRALIFIKYQKTAKGQGPLKLWIQRDKQTARLKGFDPSRALELDTPLRPRPFQKLLLEGTIPLNEKLIRIPKPDLGLRSNSIETSTEVEVVKPDSRLLRFTKRSSHPTKQESGGRDSRFLTSNLFFKKSSQTSNSIELRPREGEKDAFRVVSRRPHAESLTKSRLDSDLKRMAHNSLDLLGRKELTSLTYDEGNHNNLQARLGKMLQSLTKTQDLDILKLRTSSKEHGKRYHVPVLHQTLDHLEPYLKTSSKMDSQMSRRKPAGAQSKEKRQPQPPAIVIRKQKNTLLVPKK